MHVASCVVMFLCLTCCLSEFLVPLGSLTSLTWPHAQDCVLLYFSSVEHMWLATYSGVCVSYVHMYISCLSMLYQCFWLAHGSDFSLSIASLIDPGPLPEIMFCCTFLCRVLPHDRQQACMEQGAEQQNIVLSW